VSEENVKLARRGYDAFERGDLSGALEIFAPEMVTHVAQPIPVAGTYHGPEGFLQVMLDWAEGFDDLEQTGEEFIDAGDQVVVRTRHRSQGAASGAPVETDLWYVWTARDGQAVRVEIFNGKAEAFRAAGLSE
jgi:ketosteroid isomerase-like protein